MTQSNAGRWAGLAGLAMGLAGCGAPDEPLSRSRQAVDSFIFKKGTPPLVASDAQPSDQFGAAIGVSSLWAAVGSPGHDFNPKEPNDDTGSATVFERKQGNFWEEIAHLAPPESWPEANFGSSIAVTDELIVVGAANADTSMDGSKWGAGVIAPFAYRQGAWVAEPLLRDPNEDAYRFFGSALALDQSTLLAGAHAADQVFVFTHTADGWSAPITIDSPSPPGAGFGFSVALQEPFAFIGAPFDDAGGEEDDDQGAVFVYKHEGTAWNLQGKLERNSFAPGDLFGAALAMKGNIIAVSAYGDVSLVVFEFNGSLFANPQRLVSSDVASSADFGRSVAIGVKDSIWAGASLDDQYRGIVYPFFQSSTGWVQDVSLSFDDGGLFGFSMTSASGGLMVGAPRAGEDWRGAVFVIETSDGSSCSSDEDCFSTHCVKGICCNSVCDKTCYSCLAAEKESGSADGTCGPVRTGTKPDGGCSQKDSRTCDTNGFCDGEGACQKYAAGTQCGDPFCTGNDLVGPSLCDGMGDCASPEIFDCESYACSDQACQSGCSKDTDCGDSFYCRDARCRPKQGFGETCDSAAACLQGHCAEGICCDQACDGTCEACDEEGHLGICRAKQAGSPPRGEPSAKPAAGVDTCATLYCDGMERAAPSIPTAAETPCAPAGCTNGVEVGEGRCDGSGSCVAPTMKSCDAYACSTTEASKGRPEQCLTRCESVSDCAPNHYCTTDHECRRSTYGDPRSTSCSVSSVGGAADSSCLPLLAWALSLTLLFRRKWPRILPS